MPAFAGMTLRPLALPRPHPSEMPRAKDGHQKRAEADEHPFEDDVRAFRGEREQKREADHEIKKPPQHIDHRRGFADARR